MSAAVIAPAEYLSLGHALLAAWPGEPPSLVKITSPPLEIRLARGALTLTCPLDTAPDVDDAEAVAALAAMLSERLT